MSDLKTARRLRGEFVLALAAVPALLLGGCDNSGNAASNGAKSTPAGLKQPAEPPAASSSAAAAARPAIPDPADAGQPEVTFEKLKHDFGEISDTEKYETSFRFKNTGQGTLIIEDVKASCGCTVPRLSQYRFAPGEGDAIEIVFNPKGKQGDTNKNISVVHNGPGSPTELEITSSIKPLLAYDRMHKLGNIPLNEGHREVIKFTYTDPDLEIRNVSVSNEALHAEVVEVGAIESTEAGDTVYRAGIELTVDKDAPWGLIYATRMTIDVTGRPRPDAEPVEYAYDVYVSGNVFGDIQANPSIIGLSRLEPDTDFEKSALLRSTSGSPFQILEAKVTDTTMPGIEARVEPAGTDAHRLIVFGNAGSFKGSIRGMVTLTTDREGEEELEIRFSGFVK